MIDEFPTLLQYVVGFVTFVAISAGLLLAIEVARVVWRRGKQYVTVQTVDDGRAFAGDYEE